MSRPLLPTWAEIGLLLLILAGAAALRLLLIGSAPAGPHHDEAANLLDALDVLAGRLMVFSPRSYGREMLAMYLASPLVALLGPVRLAVRLPVAVAGILSVLATYGLARELFHAEGRRLAQMASLLAALFLALSFWLLVLNRIGFRANYLPLVETLAFLFLWRALRIDRAWAFAAAGFFFGLALHTYISARFVPVALVAWGGLMLARREGRALVWGPGGRARRLRQWLLLGGVALLVAAPLLAYFVAHPESFTQRAGSVSIFSPKLHHGDPLGLWSRSLLGNLGVFGFTGDSNPLYNLPGRPGMDAVQAAMFWIGVALCLVRWRRPPYLFLLVWWLIMLLPSILAPDPIPHYLRAIGTLPAAAIIAARPLAGLLASPPVRLRRVLPVAGLAAVAVYASVAGYSLWHTYFRVWLPRDDVYYAYYGHLADLAGEINREADPESVYLFPVNYDRLGTEYNAYTLEIAHNGVTPYQYIVVDDDSVARDLTAAAAGHRRLHLVLWTHGEHIDADPRQVLPFYLERFGQKTGERALRGYQIASYELPSAAVDFSSPLPWTPAAADYGPLKLVGTAYGSPVPSGEAAWVALRWQVDEPMGSNLRISLRLADAQGRPVGQSDADLMDNEHHLSREWPAGSEVNTYHLLPSRPGTLPGSTRLSLVVYEPESLQPLTWISQAAAAPAPELQIGALELGRPVRELVVEPEVALPRTRLARGLELLGYVQDSDALRRGESLQLGLYWHARRDVTRDYAVLIRLIDESGKTAAEWSQMPAPPTSQWREGDRWRDWHTLPVPGGLAPGQYQIAVQIEDSDLPEQPAVPLGQVQVNE